MADETHLVAQFIQLLKPWLCELRLGVIMEKIWAFSMDQPQLRVLQFAAQLIDLLSMLLRCNGFTGILKAVMGHTGSRITKHDAFLVASLMLESTLELLLSPATELVITSCHIKSTFHCMSQSN